MSVHGLNLIVPEKADAERDRVAAAWTAAGGEVTRLGRFWEPPPLDRQRVRLYANDTFALVLAQQLNLQLVSPPDEWLTGLPQAWTRRNIQALPLAQAGTLSFPIFAKSAVPKLFKAMVYPSLDALLAETRGLDGETGVLASEIVEITAEARAFLLRGQVLDLALYEGGGDLPSLRPLAEQVAASPALPATCVVDFGYLGGRGWAVIEANASWGAGLNGCAPERVLPAIAAATLAQ